MSKLELNIPEHAMRLLTHQPHMCVSRDDANPIAVGDLVRDTGCGRRHSRFDGNALRVLHLFSWGLRVFDGERVYDCTDWVLWR